jgi:2-oxo-4-hydroxy-4-carboxy-5-ureidoimidazoline decarboxylase
MDIDTVNAMDRTAFVAAFGGTFEHSPWVAARAWDARPFASAAALHAAMANVARRAPRDEQLALLNAHPELAGREAREGTMTSSSVSEQASAALDRLTPEEFTLLGRLNRAYRERHGFPFIVAVRHYTKAGILHELERRIANGSDAELEWSLGQVFAITKMRLALRFERFEAGSPSAADAAFPPEMLERKSA